MSSESHRWNVSEFLSFHFYRCDVALCSIHIAFRLALCHFNSCRSFCSTASVRPIPFGRPCNTFHFSVNCQLLANSPFFLLHTHTHARGISHNGNQQQRAHTLRQSLSFNSSLNFILRKFSKIQQRTANNFISQRESERGTKDEQKIEKRKTKERRQRDESINRERAWWKGMWRKT